MSDQAQALAKHTVQGSALKWLILSLLIIVSDQYTKYLIIERFAEFESITLHPFLDFMRLHNEGVAFSFFDEDGGWQRWFFSGLGIVVSLVIAVWLYRIPAHNHRLLAAGLACVVGGALGNVIDRINHGHVIDFIRVHYDSWYFPAFNVADSAITIGAILYIFDTIIEMGANADQQD